MKKIITAIFFLLTFLIFSSTQAQNASVSVKLFFKGTQTDKTVTEKKGFFAEKKYTFCYDSEVFDQLQLLGKASDVTISVSKVIEGGVDKLIFFKSQIELNGSAKFTIKDFAFMMGETYQITILQNENKIIFKGIIDSQGCM